MPNSLGRIRCADRALFAPLLTLAEGLFDELFSVDRNLEQQFRRDEPRLGLAAETVKPGEVIHVSAKDRGV